MTMVMKFTLSRVILNNGFTYSLYKILKMGFVYPWIRVLSMLQEIYQEKSLVISQKVDSFTFEAATG
ncbi:hypothetical protein C5167_036551 [Papaver somniferum]|uniref:Uncharacterized protein n=1 Tax=Papaver somniferum TaxID=3469 RepID=A0A4Y7I6Z2_PAPSO|nr:hypothetical protein C5167_036551 [Papaver somniferum]